MSSHTNSFVARLNLSSHVVASGNEVSEHGGNSNASIGGANTTIANATNNTTIDDTTDSSSALQQAHPGTITLMQAVPTQGATDFAHFSVMTREGPADNKTGHSGALRNATFDYLAVANYDTVSRCVLARHPILLSCMCTLQARTFTDSELTTHRSESIAWLPLHQSRRLT